MRTAVDSATTRRVIVDAARQTFAQSGYHGTSIDDVARAAGLTKGAAYHHFADKRALLEAAILRVQEDVLARVEAAARRRRDTWGRLRAAVSEMLDAASSQDVRVLLFTEGPSVLGLKRWRELDSGGHVAVISRFLTQAIASGDVEPQPVIPTARLLRALITESALAIATSEDPAKERRDVERALWTLLGSLRRHSG
jgi:AcrR family transcriptional regulator